MSTSPGRSDASPDRDEPRSGRADASSGGDASFGGDAPRLAGRDGRRRVILAIDTATSRCVVATASPAGRLDGVTTWPAGHRHGETLLPAIGGFLGEQNVRRARLAGIIVGTGPGAFTGLRVGLATAKTLAATMDLPIVGISTAEAILAAAREDVDPTARDAAEHVGAAHDAAEHDAAEHVGAAHDGVANGSARHAAAPPERFVLLLPAGQSDRLMVRPGEAPLLLPGGVDPDLAADETLIALDLSERAPATALVRGERAWAGFAAALVRLGVERLARAELDDPAELVPEYVTLPRGVGASSAEVTWSRDPR